VRHKWLQSECLLLGVLTIPEFPSFRLHPKLHLPVKSASLQVRVHQGQGRKNRDSSDRDTGSVFKPTVCTGNVRDVLQGWVVDSSNAKPVSQSAKVLNTKDEQFVFHC